MKNFCNNLQKIKQDIEEFENIRRQKILTMQINKKLVDNLRWEEEEAKCACIYINEVLEKNPDTATFQAVRSRLLQAMKQNFSSKFINPIQTSEENQVETDNEGDYE